MELMIFSGDWGWIPTTMSDRYEIVEKKDWKQKKLKKEIQAKEEMIKYYEQFSEECMNTAISLKKANEKLKEELKELEDKSK